MRERHVPGPLSLARALSKFGVCSRAEAERWIAAGRVSVDGDVVLWPARRIDPRRHRVKVDGRRVGDETERVVLALHKPPGYVTTRVEPGGRPTVYDLLGDVGRWVFPVGRLDRDSAGLLIFTNDHRLGQSLTDPGHAVPKTYHARVDGVPSEAALDVLRGGVTLGDGTRTRPARVRSLGVFRNARSESGRSSFSRDRCAIAGRGGSWLEIVLTEGKNRQVRRMCAAVGHEVRALVRVRIGGLELGDLPPGRWRRLAPRDVARLAPRTASLFPRSERSIR